MPPRTSEDELDRIRWRLDVLGFNRRSDWVLAGYGRLHAVLLALTLGATCLPLWDRTSEPAPGGHVWQILGRDLFSTTSLSLTAIALIGLVLSVWTVVSPDGAGKPVGLIAVAVILAGGILLIPGPGNFPGTGMYALLVCFGLLVVLSVVHSIHVAVIERRFNKLTED